MGKKEVEEVRVYMLSSVIKMSNERASDEDTTKKPVEVNVIVHKINVPLKWNISVSMSMLLCISCGLVYELTHVRPCTRLSYIHDSQSAHAAELLMPNSPSSTTATNDTSNTNVWT